ncbi:MAG: type VI secretion system lipoprotein TssJ [Rhodocyclaceae bacterium]
MIRITPQLCRSCLATIGLTTLVACALTPSSAPAAKEATRLAMHVRASTANNPDEKGRAGPVMVRIYELRNEAGFEGADYFSLDTKDHTILAQDILARDAFILRPGEFRDLERKMNPETMALGILIGYRDLGKAKWRAVYRLPPAPEAAWYRMAIPLRKVKLEILLDQQNILITKVD